MDWPKVKLGEVCSVNSSKRVLKAELVEEGIPFFRGTEIGKLGNGETIVPSLFITKQHYEALKEHSGVPKIGDLLMPSICPDGRIFIVSDESPFYFKDGRVLWIKVNQSQVNSTFLRFLLKSIFIHDYHNIASGTTFAELKIFALKKLMLPLPPLNEQKRIAAILNKADEIYASVSSSIGMKSAIIRSIFLDMFGDMLTNSMNWPTSPLGEVCDTQLGKAISKEAKLCLSPSKYLRNANVQWREIDFSDLKEMDFKESEKSKLRIHDGDILATEGGDVGRCAIWDHGQQEIYFQNSLHRIRVDETLLTPEYLVEYFAIMSERGGLIRETTQVTIAHLTGTKLRKLIVPLPPLSIQKRFTRILEGINSFHTSAKQRTNEIALSLQQEMFA